MVTSMNYLAIKISCLALLVLLIVSFTSKAEARNEYLNSYSNSCRYGDVDVRIETDRGDTDYIYGDSDYEQENNRLSLTFRKYLGVSKKMCDEQNKILLENENLRQELEMLKVCQRYADRPLPPQFATVEKHCKGLRARPVREKSDESLWDEMKNDYIKVNPDANIYNKDGRKKLVIPNEEYMSGPLPEPNSK